MLINNDTTQYLSIGSCFQYLSNTHEETFILNHYLKKFVFPIFSHVFYICDWYSPEVGGIPANCIFFFLNEKILAYVLKIRNIDII